MKSSILKINNRETQLFGSLSFFEANRDIPFNIKRIYYRYQGMQWGGQAHKTLSQIVFCPYGQIRMILDDGVKVENVILDDPSKGLIVHKGIWYNLVWEKDDSVLCVAASNYYDESDCIRDYGTFKEMVEDEYWSMNREEVMTKVTENSSLTKGEDEVKIDIPFDTKRIYYIYGVPKGVVRGHHAHRKLKQVLFCPYGKVEVELDDGHNKSREILSAISKNTLIVGSGIWRTMKFIEDNSVLCVAASAYYDEADYIREYNEFLQYVKEGYWNE